MTDDDYAAFVRRLFVNRSTGMDGLLHAAIGISTEAGELLDAVKKHFAHNVPLNRENVIEELGDLNFYMTALRNQLGITIGETIRANVEKLGKRYPGAVYTDAAAIARQDKA